jgi:hypothetical protein
LADRYPGLCGDMSVAGERRRGIRSASLGQTTETCLTPPSARSRRGARDYRPGSSCGSQRWAPISPIGSAPGRRRSGTAARWRSPAARAALAALGSSRPPPSRLRRMLRNPMPAISSIAVCGVDLSMTAMPLARAPSRRTASWRPPRRRRRGGAFHVASARRYPPSRSDGRSSRPSIRRSGAACPAKFQFPQMKVYSMRLATDGH